MISIDEIYPEGWSNLFRPGHPVGLGLDVATTEKNKSNPSALAATQEVGADYYVRLLLRWKTSKEEITREIIDRTLKGIPESCHKKRLCIDATSERFFAARLQRELAGTIPVELVVSSENIEYLGEKLNYKAYLGNLFVNTIDDGHLALPPYEWVSKDIRQVKRDKGSFSAEVDNEGNHADGFDGIKLSLHALKGSSGEIKAEAMGYGSSLYSEDSEDDVFNQQITVYV